MKIIIPFKTPSVNSLYFNAGKKRVMKYEYKKMKEAISLMAKNRVFTKEDLLKVSIEIHENWFIKKGIAVKDVANREKFIVDSIFEGLGINDCQIFKLCIEKVQDSEQYAVVEIFKL